VAVEPAVRSDLGWRMRLGAALRRLALTPSVVVAGMLIVAVAVRIWLTRKVAAPWIMTDELQYSELAKNFEATGHYLVRGVPLSAPTIYPILIAPAWAAASIKTAYEIAKTENVLMMTTGAIPFYLWGRRLVPAWYAVMATALLLLIPSFVYTGTLMTENAAFPAFLLAVFLIALVLERPTLPLQFAALASIALASAIRLQAVVLVLILPTAVLLKALIAAANGGALRGSAVVTEVRRYWVSLAALVVGLLAYVFYKEAQGASLRSGLSSYEVTLQVHYSIRDAARWVLYHFGEIALSVGVIPASALVVLLALGWRRGFLARDAEQAFLAVATASLWVVVEAGTFSSRFAPRIEERNMFYVVPVLLLAFVVWLAKGSPRPPRATAIAVLLPATLLLTIPLEGLLNVSLTSDTFAFIPLLRLSERLNGGASEVRTLLGLGALTAGILFVLVPRRVSSVVLPLTVALFLGLSSNSVIGRTNGFAAQNGPVAAAGVGDPSWIDDEIGPSARAAFLATSDLGLDPRPVWQTEFWNRSVRKVYDSGGTSLPSLELPNIDTSVDLTTGRISPSGSGANGRFPNYVVAASNVHLAGRLIAQQGRLALYRIRQPLQLADALNGVYPDGWMGPVATWDRYDVPHNRPTSLVVTVSRAGVLGPSLARLRVAVGPLKLVKGVQGIGKTTASRVGRIRAGAVERFRIAVPRRPFRVAVTVAPTFSPANFGSADTRQLGARVNFQLVHR
jgi:hypothetical protein